jgi:predicted enzyme related to lactoylglutathione lyase
MVTKPETIPAPFWLFYFNAGDVDAAAQRVKAGGGRIVEGPIEVPGGSCMVWCEDPQGGVFALEGTQQRKPVGYFERVAPRNPANARSRRWSW